MYLVLSEGKAYEIPVGIRNPCKIMQLDCTRNKSQGKAYEIPDNTPSSKGWDNERPLVCLYMDFYKLTGSYLGEVYETPICYPELSALPILPNQN